MKKRIEQFITEERKIPFEHWFNKLNAQAAAKVSTALYRMEIGNFSNTKGVGS